HSKAGAVRAVAVNTAERTEFLPEIPTVSEFVPGYESTIWNGIAAPRGTPFEIVDKINSTINAALSRPETKARLAGLGSTALAVSPAELGKLFGDETEKWAKVVKFSGAKPG